MTKNEFFNLLKQGAVISFNGSSASYPLQYKKAIRYYERIGEGKWETINTQTLKDCAGQLISEREKYGYKIDYQKVNANLIEDFLNEKD